MVPEQYYKDEIKRINEPLTKLKIENSKDKKEIDRLTKLAKAMQTELE